MKRKIGILGGTFDPIHDGHIHIATQAMEEYQLDEVIFIPSGTSYFKSNVSSAIIRYNMVSLALKNYPKFYVSSIETYREGNSYTSDTIQELREKEPESDFFFIIGADTLFMIEKWKNPSYLLENCKILVSKREGSDEISLLQKKEELTYKYSADISILSCNSISVSSTEIRNFRKKNPDEVPKCFPIPLEIAEYIYEKELYLR